MNAKLALFLLACLSGAASAQNGFYTGYSDRQQILLGGPGYATAWSKLAPVAKEEAAQGALFYGGYRFRGAFAVEAAVSSLSSTGNLGLRLDPRALLSDSVIPGVLAPRTQTWNLDLFTNWAVQPSLSLYGRLGYGYNDPRAAAILYGSPEAAAARRAGREGFNYGVGLRYDMSRALGLRLEYARYGFTLPGGELLNGLPESDQLSIGVQYRF
ncbi:MAG: outer membrane beta-barrel protein [Betaproteobacteria bacterium]|nr:outer membrane beta-barrel protein [Betaproteobacteria bacterium]